MFRQQFGPTAGCAGRTAVIATGHSRIRIGECFKEEEKAYHKLSSTQSEVKLGNDVEAGVDAALSSRDSMNVELIQRPRDVERALRNQPTRRRKSSIKMASIGREDESAPAEGSDAAGSSPPTSKSPPPDKGEKESAKRSAKKSAKKSGADKNAAPAPSLGGHTPLGG